MRYAHILMAVAAELWAIDENKLDQIVSFLALQASGDKLSSDELQARISRQTERDVARREGAVAVLPLRGVIANRMSMMNDISGGTSSEGFGRMFDAAMKDDGVKAIIIDVDSPGGIVTGTDDLASKIRAARGSKPIIAHVNGIAASAAYWIVASADEIVMTSASEVGSIGVLQIHDDISAALEKSGVKKTIIASGKFKGEGAPFLPLSEEAVAHRQERADSYYEDFVNAVAQGRAVDAAVVKAQFGQGRMIRAQDAIERGMADSIATLDQTVARFIDKQVVQRTPAPARAKRALAL